MTDDPAEASLVSAGPGRMHDERLRLVRAFRRPAPLHLVTLGLATVKSMDAVESLLDDGFIEACDTVLDGLVCYRATPAGLAWEAEATEAGS